MESKFTHYLITRFNVKIDGYGPEYFPPGVRTTSWEEDRMPLFEQYCVATVASQREKNFRWLIYCDTSTTKAVVQSIQTAVKNISSVQLFYVADFQEMITHIQAICSLSKTPFVITSRLDNDDGISLDYIKVVQDHFQPRDKVMLNLEGGIIYNMTKRILTHHRQSLNNSFISLIEEIHPSASLLTVYGFRHLSPPPTVTISNIQITHAFWMNLHDKNAGIRNNRGWPAFPGHHLQYYAIDRAHIPISVFNTLLYAIQWFPRAMVKKLKFILRSQ